MRAHAIAHFILLNAAVRLSHAFDSSPHAAVCIYSAIPVKAQPQVMATPQRRSGAAQAAGYSMKSTKRFLSGDVPDPSRVKMHPTSFWIKLSALLNIAAGSAYIWWRATRSMPDDPARFVEYTLLIIFFF